MENNSIGRLVVSLIWLAALLVGGGAAGLWLGLSHDGVQRLLAAAVLALTAVLAAVWLVRARAARRFNAAVEAYAERELARRKKVARAAL
jgi:hypothetical protein